MATPRKPTVTEAVEWIMLNDEPDEMDVEVVAEQVTVAMVADIFGRTTDHIALQVVRRRRAMERARSTT